MTAANATDERGDVGENDCAFDITNRNKMYEKKYKNVIDWINFLNFLKDLPGGRVVVEILRTNAMADGNSFKLEF